MNPDQILRIKNKCKSDLLFLARDVLGFTEVCVDPHQRMCDFVYGVPIDESRLMPGSIHRRQRSRGKILATLSAQQIRESPLDPRLIGARRMLIGPRGGFKSSVNGVAFAVQCIIRNRNVTIDYSSRLAEKAQKFVTQIRDCLTNATIETLFGKFKNEDDWAKERYSVCGREPGQLDYTVVTGGFGAGQVSAHADIIILDDIFDNWNSLTEDGRERVKDYYRKKLAVLNPGGFVLVLCTRWSPVDFAHYLMNSPEEEGQWDVLCENEAAWNEDGHADRLYFPTRLTEEFLKSQRRSMTGYEYSCHYRMRPALSEKTQLKPELMLRVGKEELPSPLNIVIAIDPASVDKESKIARRRCYTGMAVVGMDKDANAYVLYADKKRCPIDELAEWLGGVYAVFNQNGRGWNVRAVVIEKVAFSGLLKPALELRLPEMQRRVFFDTVSVSPRENKEERIRGALDWFVHQGSDGKPKLRVAYTIDATEAGQRFDHDALCFPDLLADNEWDMLDALERALHANALVQPSGRLNLLQQAKREPELEFQQALDGGRMPSVEVLMARAERQRREGGFGVSSVLGKPLRLPEWRPEGDQPPLPNRFTVEDLANCAW